MVFAAIMLQVCTAIVEHLILALKDNNARVVLSAIACLGLLASTIKTINHQLLSYVKCYFIHLWINWLLMRKVLYIHN